MSKKLIALDIDGTLTNSKKEITPATLAALTAAMEAGHIVAVASGRPITGIRPIAEKLQLAKYGGYVLAFNGGRIVDMATGEVAYQATLPNDVAREIYDYCVSHGLGMVTYENDNVITGTATDEFMALEARINKMDIVTVEDFKTYIDFPINKCLLTAEDKIAGAAEKELAEKYADSLTIFRSEPFFVEVMPKNVHKATSLEKLLGVLGMDKADLIACGDGYNDLSMIEYAGLGVAMANAQDVVKEAADYVTLSCDEDGLVPVIEKFVLNQTCD